MIKPVKTKQTKKIRRISIVTKNLTNILRSLSDPVYCIENWYKMERDSEMWNPPAFDSPSNDFKTNLPPLVTIGEGAFLRKCIFGPAQ